MRTFSPTTLAGSAAALALAASQIPGLTPLQASLLTLAAAVAIGLLGRMSSDCPRNCPGTDSQGRRIQDLQINLRLPPLALAAGMLSTLLCVAGCTTASRTVTTSTTLAPDSASNRVVSVTQTTSIRTLLTTVTGFDDAVSATGASHTAIGNYSGDVNMANAIFAGLRSAIGAVALAAGQTNLPALSNLFAIRAP